VKEMFKMPKKIEYPLYENIGNVELFTGRKKKFDHFLGEWYKDLEKNFAMCTAILSRRKKGKTAFLQRLFNTLWSVSNTNHEGALKVIPFYYSIRDKRQTLEKFSKEFFVQFVCQYLSYQKRDKDLVNANYEFA
jgi:hypothetical protein